MGLFYPGKIVDIFITTVGCLQETMRSAATVILMVDNRKSNWNFFFVFLLQPQLPTNQNGSAASTSGPTSGSGSLGSGSVSASTAMPGSGLSGKPRFIAVTSLDDVQVKLTG